MRTISLKLKAEATGKGTYNSPSTCPIASSLKDAGYTDVSVGPKLWYAKKKVLGFINMSCHGAIPPAVNERAHEWARTSLEPNTYVYFTVSMKYNYFDYILNHYYYES